MARPTVATFAVAAARAITIVAAAETAADASTAALAAENSVAAAVPTVRRAISCTDETVCTRKSSRSQRSSTHLAAKSMQPLTAQSL